MPCFLLCEVLTAGSYNDGVDRLALDLVTQQEGMRSLSVSMTIMHADLTHPPAPAPARRILLANTLHFVADRESVLAALVCLLKPGDRLLVVEYKGEPYATNDDSAEKRAIGEAWARASGGHGLFLMVEKLLDGLDVAAQLQRVVALPAGAGI